MEEQARRIPSSGTQRAGSAAPLGRRWVPAAAEVRKSARLAGRPARVRLLATRRAAAWASGARSCFVWAWKLCNGLGNQVDFHLSATMSLSIADSQNMCVYVRVRRNS